MTFAPHILLEKKLSRGENRIKRSVQSVRCAASPREDRLAPRAARETDWTGYSNLAVLLELIWPPAQGSEQPGRSVTREEYFAPETGRRGAPLLLHLGSSSWKARLGCACSVHCRDGPERLKVWGGGSKLLPRLGRSGKGYRGTGLAGGGMRWVTRPSSPWPAQEMAGCSWAGKLCRRRLRCWSPRCCWAPYSA